MTQADRLSRRQYARHRGVSEAAVRRAIRDGRIVVGDDARIDPVQADHDWQRHAVPRIDRHHRVAQQASDDPMDMHMARARRTAAEARLAELRLEAERARLIDREVFEARHARFVAHATDHLRRVAAELVTRIVGVIDEATVYRLIDTAHRQALHDLAEWPGSFPASATGE